MALSAALARAHLLRGSLRPAGFAAAVSPLSYRSQCQLCSTPTANEPSAAGPWDEAEAEILRDVEPVVNLVKDIIHSRRSTSVSSTYCWLSSPQDLQDDT
ncbi:unnamed protein product [Miscanthus lutarioriparius]|uniref:Uncharacterized protein n=1 Tax=Miscanthus lutarioriparius TaxID=422564 RepID=A0A811N9E4_9POAL|nr:unnamed protein product [Miscanthus lutarioriparius]